MARASAGTPTLIRPCNDNSRTAPYACVASRGEIVEQALNNDQIVGLFARITRAENRGSADPLAYYLTPSAT